MQGVLELIELQIEGLRSFSDNQTINFADRDKLVQIDGLNKDSGGSSGAGKSSVAIAIDYLFGVSSLAGTVLKPWDESKTPKVLGKFKRNGISIEITRSTKNGLTVKVGDEITSGNSKLAEEKLDEIIGLPRDIFKRLIQKRQDDGSFFVKMGPKDKYEFLIKVLNLETKNLELAFIDEEVKDFTKNLESLELNIASEEKHLSEYKELRASNIEPQCSIKESDLRHLKESILKAEALIKTLNTSKFTKIEEMEKPLRNSVEKDETKLNELIASKNIIVAQISVDRKKHQDKISGVNLIINTSGNELLRIKGIKDKAAEIGSKIKKLREEKELLEHGSTCNTCKQQWTGKGAEDRLKAIDLEISNNIKDVLEHKVTIDTEPSIIENKVYAEEELSIFNRTNPVLDIEEKANEINKNIAIEESNLNNLDVTVEADFAKEESKYLKAVHLISSEYESDINNAQESIRVLEGEFASLSKDYSINKTKIAAFKENDEKLLKLISDIENKMKNEKQTRDDFIKAIQIAKESSRCLKSFILNTFQDTLTSIGETASEILNNVPNVSTATIFFEGFKETAKGGIKNEINAVLSKNGYPDVPVKAMCGGEECAIGLAIDLAVIDIIETKSSLGTDFFIMDEPFNGLDSVCREDCLEIIKGIDSNKKIIVIDHCNELKEMVSDVITVVKENDKSTIVD